MNEKSRAVLTPSVWLNHDQAFLDQWLNWNAMVEDGGKIRDKLQAAQDADEAAVLVKQLNAHTDATLQAGREIEAALLGVNVDEVQALVDVSNELYKWVMREAWAMVREYRDGRKKASGG